MYDQAYSIANQETLELPEYYLLMGKLYDHFQESDRAIGAINKALSFNSIDRQTLFQLRLLKIRISEGYYDLKPNADNLRKVHDDLRVFIECCCSDGSSSVHCQDAQTKLQQFSQ
jgi:hypothetical protein